MYVLRGVIMVMKYAGGLRLDRTRVRSRCCDRGDGVKAPVPAWEPHGFVVDLLEDTGLMDRGEAEVLLSVLERVEAEGELVEGEALEVGQAPLGCG
jgi:hypothetical protein